MSRGKYRRRRGRRDQLAHTAAVAQLQAHITAEQDRLQQARRSAAHTAATRARLDHEVELAHRRIVAAETEAAEATRRIGAPWQNLRAATIELRRVDQHLTTTTGSRRGTAGAAARADHAIAAGLPITMPTVHHRAPDTYRYQHYHTHIGGRPETLINLEDWIPEHTPTDRDSLAVYALSTAHDNSPAAAWCWAVPPWLNRPDGTDAPQLRAALGATSSGAPTLPQNAYDGPPLPSTATITLPWRPCPLIADPSDAADLNHWYQRSGWAQGWPPRTHHPGTAAVAEHSSAARQPCMAVPFWVPDEFCGAFATAQPLPARTPLRLPFSTIFACFAQPWILPPHPDTNPDPDNPPRRADDRDAGEHRWPYPAMLHARGPAHRHAAPTLERALGRLQAWTADRSRLPTPLQVVAQLGARVEGLIFTTDPGGTPDDAFAWCLRLPHPWGTTMARILVPASRQATTWRTPVDNLLAAIALSCWHPTETGHPPSGHPSLRAASTTSNHPSTEVRVLDIDATATAGHHGRSGSGASRQPHLRRGHWRRQRVGAGRHDTRWTWVRPTTVNPGAPHATPIYRLPVATGRDGGEDLTDLQSADRPQPAIFGRDASSQLRTLGRDHMSQLCSMAIRRNRGHKRGHSRGHDQRLGALTQREA